MLTECTSQLGRNIVITGGTRGLGKLQAERALQCGASHVVVAARPAAKGGNVADGEATLAELAKAYGTHRVAYVQADVRDHEDMRSLFDPARRRQRGHPEMVHAVSLNAGIFGESGENRLIDRLPEESFTSVMDTNCTGAFLGIKEFVRAADQTKPANPSIMLVKSIYGSGGSLMSNAGYQASKFCVDGLTKQAAVELARRGIRVNSMSPAFVKTPMTTGWWSHPEVDGIVAKAHPSGQWVDTRSIADVSMFLLNSPRAVTGTDVFVDNGVHAESVPNIEDSSRIRSLTEEPCCGGGVGGPSTSSTPQFCNTR